MALGYKLPKYGVDGSFGAETQTAVKRFQEDHGITADGIVGEETQTAIAAALTQKNTTTTPEAPLSAGDVTTLLERIAELEQRVRRLEDAA